jgi:hypothetical protein
MPSKSQSILLGAAVYTVAALITGFVAINGGTVGGYLASALCCVSALLGPFVAVWHYTSTNRLTIPAGTGAGMGAAAIALGGIVSYLITLLLQAVNVYPSNAEMMERQREQLVAQGLEPEQIEQAMQMGEMFQGVAGAAINLVIAALIGAVAGAIAASVFKKGVAADDLDAV